MPSATDVNLGYGVISPIYNSKAKQGRIVLQKELNFLKKLIFLEKNSLKFLH